MTDPHIMAYHYSRIAVGDGELGIAFGTSLVIFRYIGEAVLTGPLHRVGRRSKSHYVGNGEEFPGPRNRYFTMLT
jgi:hypothetical protein